MDGWFIDQYEHCKLGRKKNKKLVTFCNYKYLNKICETTILIQNLILHLSYFNLLCGNRRENPVNPT